MPSEHLSFAAAGVGVVAALAGVWGFPAIFSKTAPWKVWIGADGKPSTSKFQFFVWTTVVVFAYAAVFAQRFFHDGDIVPVDGKIPANLLLAMGFSGGTLAAAKAITAAYVASGRVSKVADGVGNIFTDDDGQTDLSKAQLLGWTFIAVAVYIATLFRADVTQGLPDIDEALMVLMGLGHGTYLGKKLVTTDTPQLLSITPIVRPGTPVVVTGSTLGTTPGNVVLDGRALVGAAVTWEDSKVAFMLPAAHPSGAAWNDGQRVTVSIDVGGRTAANQLPLVVGLVPRPTSLSPASAAVNATVTVTGQLLAGANRQVTVAGKAANVLAGGDASTLQFTVPQMNPAVQAAVVVTVDGFPAAPLALDVTG